MEVGATASELAAQTALSVDLKAANAGPLSDRGGVDAQLEELRALHLELLSKSCGAAPRAGDHRVGPMYFLLKGDL